MSKRWLAAVGMLVVLGGLAGCGAPAGTSLTTTSLDASADAERAYNILDMQGIGPVYAGKLRTVGLSNTDKFLAATGDRKSRQALADKTGISYKLILHWARKAELMRIKGIGVKQSDLLEAVGVDSVKELMHRVPANLAERVGIANHVARPFVKTTPSEATITRWIGDAKTLCLSPSVADQD